MATLPPSVMLADTSLIQVNISTQPMQVGYCYSQSTHELCLYLYIFREKSGPYGEPYDVIRGVLVSELERTYRRAALTCRLHHIS